MKQDLCRPIRNRSHDDSYRSPPEEPRHRLSSLTVVGLVALLRHVADVRREDDIVHGEERRVRRKRLDRMDIECGAPDLSALECIDEGHLIDEIAARGVDQVRTG